MANFSSRQEVVAACMKSPLYFTMPLKDRLELMKQVEQQSVYSTMRQDLLFWIKTGLLISLEPMT
jgi:hypothetical protein